MPFGLAFGILFGVYMVALTLFEYYPSPVGQCGHIMLLGKLFRGYMVNPAGSLLGLFCGFSSGFISGTLPAWLYSLLARRNTAS